MLRKLFMVSLPLLLIACAHSAAPGISFEGKVVHVIVEGGFYGIRTSDGQRLDPVNLPEELKQDGLPVAGAYVVKEGAYSFHMWGKIVELTKIGKKKQE